MEEHNKQNHNHSECQHCLHHCSICDVVYCCKCNKQWFLNCYTYINGTSNPTTNPIWSPSWHFHSSW